jgi:hypothetical protein
MMCVKQQLAVMLPLGWWQTIRKRSKRSSKLKHLDYAATGHGC